MRGGVRGADGTGGKRREGPAFRVDGYPSPALQDRRRPGEPGWLSTGPLQQGGDGGEGGKGADDGVGERDGVQSAAAGRRI